MCDKAILENGGTLNSVPDFKFCSKSVIKLLMIL